MSNDNIADAVPVIIDTDGGVYLSPLVDNSTFGNETNEPKINIGGHYRTAWWKYTPLASGTATFDGTPTTDSGFGTDCYLTVYTGTPNPSVAAWNLTTVAFDDDSAGDSKPLISGFSVTAGVTYWIQFGSFDAASPMNLGLRVTGPHTASAPASATLDVDIQLVGAFAISRPLASSDLAVDIRLGQRQIFLANPIDVYVGMPAPPIQGFWHQPAEPADGALVPTSQPVFVVEFSRVIARYTSATVTVTYTYTDGTGPHSVALSKVVTVLPDINRVSLQPSSPIPATHVDWTYSIALSGSDSPGDDLTVSMSGTRAFNIQSGTTALQYDTPITWTVQAGTPTPHLWMVHPPFAAPGAQVTVYGHGLAATPGTVSIAGVNADVTGWTKVAASAASTGGARVIDTVSGLADSEHYEIVFTVPSAPSGPLTIQD